jgi:hypothetical protein
MTFIRTVTNDKTLHPQVARVASHTPQAVRRVASTGVAPMHQLPLSASRNAGPAGVYVYSPTRRVPQLASAAPHHASLCQRSSVARSFALSHKCPSNFVHPFGSEILEDFSIRFRRGRSYIVTTTLQMMFDSFSHARYIRPTTRDLLCGPGLPPIPAI